MNVDIVGIIVPVVLFSMIFGIVYVVTAARNKERMALIEKGADPQLFKREKLSIRFNTLKWGLFFIGIALGILFGNILATSTGLNEVASYFSMILLFGGTSLIIAYFIQRKKEV